MMHKLVNFPLDKMMAEWLPPRGEEPDDRVFDQLFDAVPTDKLEADMYAPLVKAVNESGILGDYEFFATESTPDRADPSGRKIDCGMYAKESRPTTDKRTDWSTIELSIECKISDKWDDPFDDRTGIPFSDRRRDNLGQIMNYSTLVFERQQRTHHYTLIIFGNDARIVRWDRSGAVFSPVIEYKKNPKELGLFLWRLSHASADERGHDSTACRVLPKSQHHKLMLKCAKKKLSEGDHARELFAESLVADWPWWKLTVGADKERREYLVGKPTFIAPGVVGRGTRGYVALDLTNEEHPFVYLKDCWRLWHPRSEQEGAILAYLNEKGVVYIPTGLVHGDVDEQRTLSQDIWVRIHESADGCPLKTHVHYRLVVKEVGLPLKRFRTGKELVGVFLDCLMAHEDAYEKAKVMHRDISVGNIIMVPKIVDGETIYQGFLTDWELSKRLDQYGLEPSHPDRTGTWQFMSVNALDHPGKQMELADEFESMFHAMLWCAIRYLPHNCSNVGEFMNSYFDEGVTLDHMVYMCGEAKSKAITIGELTIIGRVPLVFLRERPSQIVAEDLASSTASHSGTSSQSGETPIPQRPRSPTPMSMKPARPSAHKKEESLDAFRTYTDEQRHPIGTILDEILKWFYALYTLRSLEKERKKLTTNKVLDSGIDAAASQRYATTVLEKPSKPSVFNRESLQKDAGNLQSHCALGHILYASLVEASWPENDKLSDQLHPNYRPDKQTKVRMKDTIVDSAKGSMKRSGLHEETFEVSDGKRPRSGSSHFGA
ncbi:hypothetical protein BV20DRAFT_1113866 [Pilatotrama ljubarskyi]|nr:hypothetical protein BV20DRAFT_1113866 [Pilatotrama ljubarskyi]